MAEKNFIQQNQVLSLNYEHFLPQLRFHFLRPQNITVMFESVTNKTDSSGEAKLAKLFNRSETQLQKIEQWCRSEGLGFRNTVSPASRLLCRKVYGAHVGSILSYSYSKSGLSYLSSLISFGFVVLQIAFQDDYVKRLIMDLMRNSQKQLERVYSFFPIYYDLGITCGELISILWALLSKIHDMENTHNVSDILMQSYAQVQIFTLMLLVILEKVECLCLDSINNDLNVPQAYARLCEYFDLNVAVHCRHKQKQQIVHWGDESDQHLESQSSEKLGEEEKDNCLIFLFHDFNIFIVSPDSKQFSWGSYYQNEDEFLRRQSEIKQSKMSLFQNLHQNSQVQDRSKGNGLLEIDLDKSSLMCPYQLQTPEFNSTADTPQFTFNEQHMFNKPHHIRSSSSKESFFFNKNEKESSFQTRKMCSEVRDSQRSSYFGAYLKQNKSDFHKKDQSPVEKNLSQRKQQHSKSHSRSHKSKSKSKQHSKIKIVETLNIIVSQPKNPLSQSQNLKMEVNKRLSEVSEQQKKSCKHFSYFKSEISQNKFFNRKQINLDESNKWFSTFVPKTQTTKVVQNGFSQNPILQHKLSLLKVQTENESHNNSMCKSSKSINHEKQKKNKHSKGTKHGSQHSKSNIYINKNNLLNSAFWKKIHTRSAKVIKFPEFLRNLKDSKKQTSKENQSQKKNIEFKKIKLQRKITFPLKNEFRQRKHSPTQKIHSLSSKKTIEQRRTQFCPGYSLPLRQVSKSQIGFQNRLQPLTPMPSNPNQFHREESGLRWELKEKAATTASSTVLDNQMVMSPWNEPRICWNATNFLS